MPSYQSLGTSGAPQSALVVSMLLLVLLGACGGPPAPTVATNTSGTPNSTQARPASTPVGTFDLRGADPRLAALRTARTIEIWDDSYPFYALFSPVVARYTLTRSADRFAGEGAFEVTGNTMGGTKILTHSKMLRVAIPADAATAFLLQLAMTPLKDGAYMPPERRTDHENHQISVTLETDAGSFAFVNERTYLALWGVTNGPLSWVSASDAPERALTSLEPFLHMQETLKELQDRVGHDVSATYAARPTATFTPPEICGLPKPSARVMPTVVASPGTTSPPVLRPGDPIRIGDLINLADYYELPGDGVVELSPTHIFKEADKTISDPQRLAAFYAALDQPSPVLALSSNASTVGVIPLLIKTPVKPVYLGYLPQSDLLAFGLAPTNHAIAAPPEIRTILEQQLCTR